MASGGYVPRLFNRDGSRNIYCKRNCGRLISTLPGHQANFGSAICAICYAAETGEPLSEEIQDDLRNNVKLESGLMVPRDAIIPTADKIPEDPMMGRFALTDNPSYWRRVITAFVFAAKELITPNRVDKKTQEPMSKVVAREKRSKRVFRIEDNDNKFVDLTSGNFKE